MEGPFPRGPCSESIQQSRKVTSEQELADWGSLRAHEMPGLTLLIWSDWRPKALGRLSNPVFPLVSRRRVPNNLTDL